jgi:hypothetical protein
MESSVVSGLRDAEATELEVYEASRERVMRHEAHARAFGIALPPPLYEAGTITLKCADDVLRARRAEWEQQPRTLDAIDEVRVRIAAERRSDFTVRTTSLSMLDDGRLHISGMPESDAFVFEERGFTGFIRQLRAPFGDGAAYLLGLEPSVRARVFNAQMARTRLPSGRFKLAVPARVRLRTRQVGRHRTVYAAVSANYAPYNADRLLTDVSAAMLNETSALLDTARGPALYDPTTSRAKLDVVWHADAIRNLAVGDVFKGGLRISTADAGNGALRIDLVLWRNRCINMAIVEAGTRSLVQRAHRGSFEQLASEVAGGIRAATGLIEGFAEDWNLLRGLPADRLLVGGARGHTAEQALTVIARSGVLDGLRSEATERGLLEAWRHEPGSSAADVVNAITRYAHEGGLNDERRDVIERIAGRLVKDIARRSTIALVV